ncbi:MAG: glycogen synthase GlgA [Firmicutes bacterium]|nr:glycogen synthase GlgA [Bacillota bacterium]
MKVLFAASECVPFIKTGGLADVVGALPPVLKSVGVDVRVILPLYGEIAETYKTQMRHLADFELDLGWRKQYCGIETLEYLGLTWYFVDNRYYFDRPYIYGPGGDEYERYGFYCRAVLNALPLIGFQPDILHCHDWQAGMIPALLKIQYSHLPFFARMRCVLTIHNLQYQGIFRIKEVQDCLGLGDSLFTSDKLEAYGMANYLKAGIVYADEITTVSPSYAQEITTAYYGERLDGLLRARHQQLTGILNGIDTVEYDPATDLAIPHTFTADTPEGKAACKAGLQRELGLAEAPDVPLMAMVTRLSIQKGLDLIDYMIARMMEENIQFVILGKGEARYTDMFSWAESAYPGRVAARFEMNHGLAHRIYAGADMFLMPSLFEPCGLSQMISLRYGTLPIVRETGGLRDTVLSYNDYTGEGNGFTFFNYNAHDMVNTIRRAVTYYTEKKDIWQTMMRRGMTGDYSWNKSAGEYISLYEKLVLPPYEEPKRRRAPARKAPAEKAAPAQKTKKAAPAAKASAPKAPLAKAKTAAETKAAPKRPRAKKTAPAE